MLTQLREADMLKRYKLVVHMVTIADGMPEAYQNSVQREETIEVTMKPLSKPLRLMRHFARLGSTTLTCRSSPMTS